LHSCAGLQLTLTRHRGRFDDADQEKIRLEDKQRKKRHERNEQQNEWSPTWFYRDMEEDTGEEHWVYKGGYWEARDSARWPEEVPDIY
jgi:hypothetical protein